MSSMPLFSKSSQRTQGWLYNVSAQTFWGTSSIATSLVDKMLPSALLVGIRHGIGAVLLGMNVLRSKRQIFKNAPWFHLIVLGVLAGGLPDLLLVEAIRRCGPIIAVLLARLEIPLGVLFAHLFLKEKVTSKAYVASVLGMVGGCLISFKPGQSLSLHSSFYLGVIIAVGAGVAWAMSSVYGKYILNRQVDALALTFVRLSLGSLCSLILTFLLVTHPLQALIHLRLQDWLLLLYIGVFCSGLGYLLFYRSMELIDAHVAQILVGISLAVALVLGLAIGLSISLLQWIGIAIVGYSIYLIKAKPDPID